MCLVVWSFVECVCGLCVILLLFVMIGCCVSNWKFGGVCDIFGRCCELLLVFECLDRKFLMM